MITKKELFQQLDSFSLSYCNPVDSHHSIILKYEEEKSKSINEIILNYSNEHIVSRIWNKFKKKKFCYPKHLTNNKWEKGLGDRSLWMPYQNRYLIEGQNKWILWHEGEKATDYAINQKLLSTCIVGAGFKDKTIITNALNLISGIGIEGIIYIGDHDDQGLKKGKYIQEYAFKLGIPFLILPIKEIFPTAQKGDDIVELIQTNIDTKSLKSLIESSIDDIKDLVVNHYLSWGNMKTPVILDIAKAENNLDKLIKYLEKNYSHRLRYNELSRCVELDGKQARLDNLHVKIYKESKIKVSKQDAFDFAVDLAENNPYHPVKEYFHSLKKPANDYTDITKLSTLLFGNDHPLYNEMVYRTLIGSVARIYEAGCKFDTALILQGKQGIGKSTFFKTLYGEQFFTDSVVGTDRDSIMVMNMYWCCELAEFDYLTGKKATGELKAFLSKSTDTIREPYGRQNITIPRQSIIVGSVNKAEFLQDETGNRRFWVIPVEQKIDNQLIKEIRDEIWYWAIQAYKNNEKWHLPEKYQDLSNELNEQYLHTDSWDSDELDNYLLGFESIGIPIRTILINHIGLEEKDINRSHEMRITKILTSKGWYKKQVRIEQTRKKMWFK